MRADELAPLGIYVPMNTSVNHTRMARGMHRDRWLNRCEDGKETRMDLRKHEIVVTSWPQMRSLHVAPRNQVEIEVGWLLLGLAGKVRQISNVRFDGLEGLGQA